MERHETRTYLRPALIATLLVVAVAATVFLVVRAAEPVATMKSAAVSAPAKSSKKPSVNKSALAFAAGPAPAALRDRTGPYAAYTTVSVEETACYTGVDGNAWVDGTLTNDTATSVTDVSVTVEYHNSVGGTLGWVVIPADCHVIEAASPASAASFSSPVSLPPGTDPTQCTFTAAGTPTARPVTELLLHTEYTAPVVGTDGSSHYDGTVTNDSSVTVSSIIVGGAEDRGDATATASFFDALSDITYTSSTLAPGDSVEFSIDSPRSATGRSDDSYPYLWAEAVPYAPLQVYRFYKPSTGTHFYTADPAERDNVINTLGAMYHYEGPVYSVNTASPSNMHPLYRFYNLRTGTHFYTADEGEKNNVINTLGYLYHYDGIAYDVSSFDGTFDGFSQPVYRFYNRQAGTHFYTADPAERDNVINTMGWLYSYEGPAYYLAY
jgi:hypothetical protein